MVANIGFSPYVTSNAAGSFSTSAAGFFQGVAMDDPASRNYLAGGPLAQTETLPMWGGVAISEIISTPPTNPTLGPLIKRAANVAGIQGFSVFNQAVHWLTTPQSQVPLGTSGSTVMFYRFGSNARIAVQMDPAMINLDGGMTTQQVSWDFVNQRLVPYFPAETGETITAMTWASGVVSVTTSAAHGLVVGDDITITGVVPAGYNGSYTILSVPSSTTFTYALPNGGTSPGTVTTQGAISAGGGALPVRVLETQAANCMTVAYDPINNVANWNRNGACALILI